MVQIIDGIEHHLFRLSGKIQYNMHNYFDSQRPEVPNSVVKYVEFVSSPDEPGCFRMNRLKSQFHPDWLSAVQPPEQIQHIAAQTVRTGGDGKNFYFRIFNRFGEDLFR